MNTLDELIYYCNEEEPVGALLLTGEWGCGKTYLIEKMLQKSIAKTAFVLRISLFGITNTDGIHMAVKQAWLDAYCKEKGISSLAEKTKKLKKVISAINVVPDVIKGITTSDFTSLIVIKNKIGGKSVILVFDDLERCRMDYVDVLGAINDYCENMKIHTVIVANQDKIRKNYEETIINAVITEKEPDGNVSSKIDINEKSIVLKIPAKEEPGAIPYIEIKEKIIQRTVQYIPDFEAIIAAVIEEMRFKDETYKEFVSKCQSELLELFAPDRSEEVGGDRPHNIRSLKCAISDFYRVYEILTRNQIENIDKWFYSFTSYVIAYKAGVAREGVYGTLFTDEEVKKLYPAFQNQYMFSAVKKWILNGAWEEKKIEYEIELRKKQERASSPCEILKSNRIMDVNEDVIINGFSDMLKEAYNGVLTLDEYVQFIMNSFWARKYDFTFPEEINWLKVQGGVDKCIKKLTETLPEEQQVHVVIGDDNKENFTVDEWKTYEVIKNFKDGNRLMFIRNRKLYIEQMSKDSSSAFLLMQNKRFNGFDVEMAKVTAKAFKNSSNEEKSMFSGYFKAMWNGNIDSEDMNFSESIEGFRVLLHELEEQKKHLEIQKKAFAKLHTEKFIELVRDLIDRVNEVYDMQQVVDELNDELRGEN